MTPERNKEWEYMSPSAMKLFNMSKKTGSYGFANCQEMASAIVGSIEPDNEVIERVELAQAGQGDPAKSGFFLNIFLKPEFIQGQISNIYLAPQQAVRLQEAIDLEKS